MLNSLSFKTFVCIQNGTEDSHVSSVYRLHGKPLSSNKRQSWVSNLGILNLKPGVIFYFNTFLPERLSKVERCSQSEF